MPSLLQYNISFSLFIDFNRDWLDQRRDMHACMLEPEFVFSMYEPLEVVKKKEMSKIDRMI